MVFIFKRVTQVGCDKRQSERHWTNRKTLKKTSSIVASCCRNEVCLERDGSFNMA